MKVGWMYLPSEVSPKISSMSLPLPMVSSTSTPRERAVLRSSSSSMPVMSTPVFSRMASIMGTRRKGALKEMTLSPTFTSVEPLTVRQMCSRSFSVKRIIQL